MASAGAANRTAARVSALIDVDAPRSSGASPGFRRPADRARPAPAAAPSRRAPLLRRAGTSPSRFAPTPAPSATARRARAARETPESADRSPEPAPPTPFAALADRRSIHRSGPA